MSHLFTARENQAKSIIAALEKRNMTGHYCATKEECLALVLSLMPESSSVAWGGSESIKECGIPSALQESGKYTVYDRSRYVTPAEQKQFYALAFQSDYFFMSTNAITLDGELVNIDGAGNRLSSLIFGPEHVIVVAGMNKVVANVEEGVRRTRNIASPPNTVRLNKNTPCAVTGKCGDCMSPDCICNQIVITRRSRDKDRIHVILVNDNLGF
ncbi:MAG: lactate utilization protein [Ruminococcaceae bacterium]|nr:lactate utilization protein [Oscillospiraceae bacterium]